MQPFLAKYAKQPPTEPPAQSAPAPVAPSQPAPQPSVASAAKPAPTAPSVPAKQAAGETDTVVENDLYRITFTNRGAQVKSWVLKKFNDDQGQPLDMVNSAAAAKFDGASGAVAVAAAMVNVKSPETPRLPAASLLLTR